MATTTEDKPRSIISWIVAYKELAMSIAMSLGAIMWVFGYFATKSELAQLHARTEAETTKIQCILRLNIEWLAGEQLWKISYDELHRIEQQLRVLAPRPETIADPTILPQMLGLEHRRKEVTSDLEAARLQKNESRSRLMRGECNRD